MIQEELRNIIAQSLGVEPEDVLDSSLLKEDLGLEAEELAEIVGLINQRYHTEIDQDVTARAKTVEELFEIVSGYVPENLE